MADYATQLTMLQYAMLAPMAEQDLPWIKHTSNPTFTASHRLAVYANGYIIRMCNAVMSEFPALQHYLGVAQCEKIIQKYVQRHPSFSWDLNGYHHAFPAFMHAQGIEEAACALATLEATISDVFWSPESPTITADRLVSLDEDSFAEMQAQLSSTTRLLHLPYDAHAYLQAFREEAPTNILPHQAIYLLVVRHAYEVKRIVIDARHFTLLSQFQQPRSFNEAFMALTEAEELSIHLPNYMALWLEYGVLQHVEPLQWFL